MLRVSLAIGLLLSLSAACGRNTDITRRDAAVDAWVAQERAKEAERKRAREAAPAAQPAQLPSATPDKRPVTPETAPPPRSRSTPPPGPATTRQSQQGTSAVTALGTCFAIDGSGTIVTAEHVIEGSRAVYVRFGQEDLLPAKVLAASASSDVAVLRVERATTEFLPLAAPHGARVGMPVFTVGFPVLELLGADARFTDGTVSALSGVQGEGSRMQISVPLQPGNSGGPLLSDRGEVLGVTVAVTAADKFYAATGTLPQNINFASKAENLRAILPNAPAPRAPTKTREAAIDRAMKAVCIVAASR